MNNDFYAILDGASNRQELYPLAKLRSTSAIPFFGRYRLVDFTVSSLVNSGCTNISIYTSKGANSLHDHLKTGEPWGLNTNRDGLFIIDMPFEHRDFIVPYYVIKQNIKHFELSRQQYVVLGHSLGVHKIEFDKYLAKHIESGSDISILTKNGCPINFYIMTKELLQNLVETSAEYFEVNVVDSIDNRLELNCKEIEIDSYYELIATMSDYYNKSLSLLEAFNNGNEVTNVLNDERSICTKRNHSSPTIFTGDSKLFNSTIANGCTIHGEINDSIIFRNVEVSKDSVIKKSIVLPNVRVGKNVIIENAIIDKNVVIKDGSKIVGNENHPIYISKNQEV